jgi:bifunctional DNA-binding transcriptional regulator/antitoxin component of YhaV-PrlF toxin-antitoxin module
MTIIETAKITSKGQVTIPVKIRNILRISTGASIAFGISKKGVIMVPCRMTAELPYSEREWRKIEKLASARGKVYTTAKSAMKHIENL